MPSSPVSPSSPQKLNEIRDTDMIDGLLTRVRSFLRRVFILPLWLTPLIAVPSFVLLFYTFSNPAPELLRFISYHLSAYALAISVTWWMRVWPWLRRRSGWVRSLRASPVGMLLSNKKVRAWAAVYLSMLWNLIYALAKLVTGMALRSAWLRSMGIYYLVLAWLRFTIVKPSGHPVRAVYEWERYRACGIVLLVMNLALISVVLEAVAGGSVRYPGPLIYLMAAYTFWAFISCTVKLARVHRRGDVRMSAARAVSLTAAMVSMLSLEIALIDRFGGDSQAFRERMIGLSGGAVCMIELGVALYMIRRGGVELKRIENERGER